MYIFQKRSHMPINLTERIFTAGQVSELSGASRATVANWTAGGLVLPWDSGTMQRRGMGLLAYTATDAMRFRLMFVLHSKYGMPVRVGVRLVRHVFRELDPVKAKYLGIVTAGADSVVSVYLPTLDASPKLRTDDAILIINLQRIVEDVISRAEVMLRELEPEATDKAAAPPEPPAAPATRKGKPGKPGIVVTPPEPQGESICA
jgi:hypothetical protein